MYIPPSKKWGDMSPDPPQDLRPWHPGRVIVDKLEPKQLKPLLEMTETRNKGSSIDQS